jgi:uncharacterized membrane protein
MDINELMQSEDLTKNYEIQDINANKPMGILAYIGLLVLVPIFTARESKFAMFHAEQGITLCIAAHVIGLLAWIFSLIPVVGFVFSIISGLVGLVVFGLMILGIVNSVNGQAKQLPLVGKFTIFKLQ